MHREGGLEGGLEGLEGGSETAAPSTKPWPVYKTNYTFYKKKLPTWQGQTYQHTGAPLTPENMKDMRAYLTTLLRETVSLLEQYQIRYIIGSGTLLGYERDKDFIPWDDDVDIRVHGDDWTSKLAKLRNFEMTKSRKHGDSGVFRDMEIDARVWDLDKHSSLQIKLQSGIGMAVQGDDVPHMDLLRADLRCCPPPNHDWLRNMNRTDWYMCCTGENKICCGEIEKSRGYLLWHDVQYAFEQPTRKVTMAGVDVMAPAENVSDRILQRNYGANYREIDEHVVARYKPYAPPTVANAVPLLAPLDANADDTEAAFHDLMLDVVDQIKSAKSKEATKQEIAAMQADPAINELQLVKDIIAKLQPPAHPMLGLHVPSASDAELAPFHD